VITGASTDAVSLAMQQQQKSEWCWAAVSASVDRFFRPGSTHTQCDIAGSVLELPCCNPTPAQAGPCNVPHDLHTVLGRLHLLAGDPVLKPLTFPEIQKEIDAARPICVLIKWLDKNGQPTRGHFIAISGYRVTPAQKQFLSIADPFFGSSEIDYTIFCNPKGGYRDGSGMWFASFLVQNEAVAQNAKS
jgi:hypothetical protein